MTNQVLSAVLMVEQEAEVEEIDVALAKFNETIQPQHDQQLSLDF